MKAQEKKQDGKGKDMKMAIIVSLLKKKGKGEMKKEEKCEDCGKSPCQCED